MLLQSQYYNKTKKTNLYAFKYYDKLDLISLTDHYKLLIYTFILSIEAIPNDGKYNLFTKTL